MEHGFFCVPLLENFREQQNIWKSGRDFPDGIFQTEIRVTFIKTFLWYQLQVNGTDFYK